MGQQGVMPVAFQRDTWIGDLGTMPADLARELSSWTENLQRACQIEWRVFDWIATRPRDQLISCLAELTPTTPAVEFASTVIEAILERCLDEGAPRLLELAGQAFSCTDILLDRENIAVAAGARRRAAAAMAPGMLSALRQWIQHAADDDRDWMRVKTIEALADMGVREVVPVLVEMVATPSVRRNFPNACEAAAQALADLDARETAPALRRLLRGELGEPDLARVIEDLLADWGA
jgi:hypothetical protein